MLAGVQVEHELRQRTVQAGEFPAQHGEARARQFRGRLGVEPALARAEFGVVLRLEVEAWRFAEAADLDVGLLIGTFRH